jgi:hypothetical protein
MFGIFKRTRKFQPTKVLTHRPAYLIEVEVNGDMIVSASWPRPTTPDDLNHVVKVYTTLLFLLKDTKMAPLFQHALSAYAVENNDEDTLRAILGTYHNIVNSGQQVANQQEPGTPNKPVISPLEVFK